MKKMDAQILAGILLLGVCRLVCTSVPAYAQTDYTSIQTEQETRTEGMPSGWQQTEEGAYYFSPETGEMQTGIQVIEGETYYFSSESGKMQTGLQKAEGETYYFSPETGEMETGLQEVKGETYYFSPKTGQMQYGIRSADGERYYFSPETGEMRTGWQEIKGKRYYCSKESGEMLTGRQKIGGKAYFFDTDGVLQTKGWVKSKNGKYYADKKGVLKSGWQKIGKSRYYFLPQNNKMAAGKQKIGGSYYIFDKTGRLADTGKVSLVTVGKETYCADRNGKAATGWRLIGGRLYYAAKTGALKKNTTYQGISFQGNGAARDDFQTRLKIKIIQTAALIMNDGMSKSQKLRACWSYLAGGGFRYAVKYPNFSASGWQRRTAYDMLSTHTGNCYGFACAFAALAEEAGYQPYIVCGRVRGSRDRAADGYTRHAWVKIDGRYYDPEGQYAGWLRGVYGAGSYPTSHTVQSVVRY